MNLKQIADWVEQEFPGIKERAKEESAEIFWGDETGVQNPPANYLRACFPSI